MTAIVKSELCYDTIPYWVTLCSSLVEVLMCLMEVAVSYWNEMLVIAVKLFEEANEH